MSVSESTAMALLQLAKDKTESSYYARQNRQAAAQLYRDIVLASVGRVDNPSALAKDIADQYYTYLTQENN